MFKRIILPFDGTQPAESAVSHAMALAAHKDAKVTVAHVLENNRDGHRNVEPMEWHMRMAAATLAVEKLANKVRKVVKDVDVEVLSGHPAERIVELAERCNADLVILTRRTGALGGVARKTIDRIGRSILLVNVDAASSETDSLSTQSQDSEDGPYHYRSILAPLDGSPRAECVLPIVQSLALRHHSLISVANVIARPWMASSMPLTEEDRALMQRLVDRSHMRAEQYLENVCAQFSPDRRVTLRTGDNVAEELHNIVAQEAIDLVILSAHGATNDRVRPYGAIASDFISYAKSHVLIFQDNPPAKHATQREALNADGAKNLNLLARSYA